MGLWTTIKDALTKSPLEEYRDERKAEREAEDTVPADLPETPDDVAVDDAATEAPGPEPEVPAEPEYRTYTVKKGDTLSEIAQRYGVDWHEMARLNELENPDLIFPGQVFKVPND